VFDNGAVLRSTNNMPVGLSVILSNPKGRDVVCRVVGGRNLPSIKGYVEVEFLEPVNDFWGIHQDSGSVPVAPPESVSFAARETVVPRPPVIPRASGSSETSEKSVSGSLGSGPSFEDIPGLLTMPSSTGMRTSRPEPARPGPLKPGKDVSNYDLSESARPTSVANWRPQSTDQPTENYATSKVMEASPTSSSTSAPSHDFLSKGLMAYEQSEPSSSPTSGRMPLIAGVAALALVGVGAVVFLMHRGTAPVPVARTSVASPSSPPQPAVANTVPEPTQAPQEAAARTVTETQPQAQPVPVDSAQPATAISPALAVVTNPETTDSHSDPRNTRKSDKKPIVTKQPEPASSRQPAIANLKLASPSAPKQNLANPGEAAAPLTEIASTEALGGSAPAGLLTSAGRISNPPVAPPSAPAPAPAPAVKTVREPKLISSVRPVYPPTAKQSNIQGTVTVSATIDQSGKVISARALNGPLLLQQAAADSVKQWKYSPGLEDGKPATSRVIVNVEFRLN